MKLFWDIFQVCYGMASAVGLVVFLVFLGIVGVIKFLGDDMNKFYKEDELREKMINLFKRTDVVFSKEITPEELADKIINYYDKEWDSREEFYEQGYRDAKSGN